MPRASTRVLLPACVVAVAVVGLVGATVGRWVPPRLSWVDADNLAILAEVAAAVCCWVAGRRGRGRLRTSWWLLGAMVAMYAAGDVLWVVLANAAGTPPLLSVADSLYLVALVPGALGLVLYPVTRGWRSAVGPVLLDVAVLGSSVILASQVFVFREVLDAVSAADAFILLVYPVTDLLLACLVLILMLRSVGDPRPDVVLLGLAFLTYALADNGYALAYVRGTDVTEGLVAAAYLAAPLFLAAAALASVTFSRESRLLEERISATWPVVLPDLAALTALAVSVVWWLEDTLSGALAAVVLVLTGARQVFSTSRAHRWRYELERRIEERTHEIAAITERHRELDSMKYAFLSVVSHELRTPLTAIRSSLELLEDGDGGELTAHGRRVVTIGLRGTQRLSRIVDDIVDLERFQTGGFGITPERQVLRELFDELADVLEPVARTRKIDLVVDGGAVVAWCDGDRVMQALINLTGNALKFAPSGSQVVVGAETGHDGVVVSISDRGRGIPADQVALVFERFHQVDPVGDQAKGGAGLGLTITQHIVQAHGGRIWVESEPGEGATFRFTLPAEPPRPPVSPGPGPTR